MSEKAETTFLDSVGEISKLQELLSADQWTLLKEHLHYHRYKKDDIVYNEHDKPEWLYCVLSGKVRIYRKGVGGRCQIMRMVQTGEYFGYRAYFAHECYVTSASTSSDAMLCLMPLTVIDKLVKENNKLAYFFIQQLAHDLGRSDERTVNLTQKHTRARLAENLLFLKDTYGLEEDGATIGIYLSREDLANLSNMTTANAIRTLSHFADEHLIAVDGRKIKIIDETGLKSISQLG